MTDLLENKTEGATKAPPAPLKRRLDRRPGVIKAPRPRIYRWIQWMALFVVMGIAGILAATFLASGDDETATGLVGREAEHGEFTPLAVRELTGVDLTVRFAGQDANLDPDVVTPWIAEHGEFTPLAVRDLTGVDLTVRFAGQDANLDPYVVEPWAEHGEFTPLAVRDLTGIDLTARFAGQDANLDP